ncbi:MAG: TonB-dependent siderophore receptor [Cyanobacteria bacterium P01_F01_bin.150]
MSLRLVCSSVGVTWLLLLCTGRPAGSQSVPSIICAEQIVGTDSDATPVYQSASAPLHPLQPVGIGLDVSPNQEAVSKLRSAEDTMKCQNTQNSHEQLSQSVSQIGDERIAQLIVPSIGDLDDGDEDFYVPDSSAGTRTDTPIIEVPATIQVIPDAVIESQTPLSTSDILRNSAGATTGRVSSDNLGFLPIIRGFESQIFLRNGLPDSTLNRVAGVTNIESVEIVRGPISLYGLSNLGGTVNFVTEQPLDDPFYSVEYTLGEFGLHRPSLDFSIPLNSDDDDGDDENGDLALRVNATYENSRSFRDDFQNRYTFVSPVLRAIDTEDTSLVIDMEYFNFQSDGGTVELPAVGTVVDNPNGEVDLDANLGSDPDFASDRQITTRVGYLFSHNINDDWTIRNEFLYSSREDVESTGFIPRELLEDQRTLLIFPFENPSTETNINLNTNISGEFTTGPINHDLLVGVELARATEVDILNFSEDTVDIFTGDRVNPIPFEDLIQDFTTFENIENEVNTVGVYLQDQIKLLDDRLIFVAGGRVDFVDETYEDLNAPELSYERNTTAFSPRLGLVYMPSENISVYGSFARSFFPVVGREVDENDEFSDAFEPERGTQFEIGVKAELNEKLLATLALYDLTRTNLTVENPSGRGQLQLGEQQSQGIELNVTGEILSGWNVFAGYAYTDARVAEDDQFSSGNAINNVARNAVSLWTTYELQKGSLEGLGFGLGLFYQSEREGDLDNTFELPSFLRTDATIFYKRDRLRTSLTVQNLFNEEIFEGARSNVRVIPGAPRTVLGQIAWEL